MCRRACFCNRQPNTICLRNFHRIGYIGFHFDLHGFAFCGNLHGVGRNDNDALDKIDNAHDGIRSFGDKYQNAACFEVVR